MRVVALFLLAVFTLNAGVIAGVRYGQITQNAKFEGVSAEEKKAWGAGFVAGYEAENYRILLSHDTPNYDKPAKSTISAISAQLMDEDTQGIKGFLGFTYARASYTHSADTEEKKNSFDLMGGDIGLILLDERFPRMQMEIGARYLAPSNLPKELKMKPTVHFYAGFNFILY